MVEKSHPVGVEVDAALNDGVLTLRILKPHPAARKSRKIEVRPS